MEPETDPEVEFEPMVPPASLPAPALLPTFVDDDQDVLVVNTGTGPVFYRNDTPPDANWLTVRPVTARSARSDRGIGVRVIDVGGREQFHWVTTGGSDAAQVPAEAHFGFGDVAGPVTVELSWAGSADPVRLDDVATRQVLDVVKPSSG